MGETKLPPGMIMGPDGKPCKACTSGAAFRNWKPPSGKATTAIGAGAGTMAATTQKSIMVAQCPPDKEQLGCAMWTFLHTATAYYPERPSPTQRANMLGLIRALPVLYPCTHCAEDFGERVAANLQDRHNEVNERLGKEAFDCGKMDERWKDGPADSNCD
ncbi:ERV/ALR sulfhydryl oxidase domain-containing protein [Mycena crocata]|nr:ERV/ALR sulfhydryl oxidase domain-containing protein [Mycena crocata]